MKIKQGSRYSRDLTQWGQPPQKFRDNFLDFLPDNSPKVPLVLLYNFPKVPLAKVKLTEILGKKGQNLFIFLSKIANFISLKK